jgi:hypothetical protein
VLGEAGGYVGVGLGEDIGVDAEGEAGADGEVLGACGEKFEFLLGFNVELEDVGFECCVDLPGLFAYSGEDDFFQGVRVGATDALEFATGDDVEAGALAAEETEDCEGGVGFDGVADGVRARGEGLLKELEALRDLRGGVDVERRAVFFRKRGERDLITVKRAVAVDEWACGGGRRGSCCGLLQNGEALS